MSSPRLPATARRSVSSDAVLLSRFLLGALLVAAGSLPGAEPKTVEVSFDCRIVDVTADGVYVDVGMEDGVRNADSGWLRQAGTPLVSVQVDRAARRSSFLVLTSGSARDLPAPGAAMTLVVEREAVDEAEVTPVLPPSADSPESRSPTLRERGTTRAELDGSETSTLEDGGEDGDGEATKKGEFVPLLAPPWMEDAGYTDAQNIFHGRLTLRQFYQLSPENAFDYASTRLRSTGSVERVDRTPWALEWSGELSYRDGDLYEDVRDYRELRLEVYRVALFRRFDDRSFVRLGRFIPSELPSAGYLDGAQGEKVLNENVRAGAMLGFKPSRNRLGPTFDEPTAVPYLTVSAEKPDGTVYSLTGGVLASLYEGDPDRLAALVDHRYRRGKFDLFASAEVDVDIGGAEFRDGPRLSRLNVVGSYRFSPLLTVRAGVDRWERPDTEAERDAVDDLVDPNFLVDYFDRGYWRYFVGASHELFWNLYVSEEITLTDSETDDYTPRGRVSITRTGLPLLPRGSITLSAYNLTRGDPDPEKAVELDGIGGRLDAYLPLQNGLLSLRPSIGYRAFELDTTSEEFYVTDASLRADWTISRSWMLNGGVTYTLTDEVERVLVDLALTFRW